MTDGSAYGTDRSEFRFGCLEIGLMTFLGIAWFLGLWECIAAFIRNTHVLGFIVGAILFFLSAIALTLLIAWAMKYQFYGNKKTIILIITGACAFLLCFVICFLTVKIFNYSQKSPKITDLDDYRFYPDGCIKAAREWAKVTFQSRIESSKITERALVYYMQVSHTDVFLGLIVDTIYILSKFLYSKIDC